MAAITPSTVVTTGLLAAPAAVSASDTISGDLVPAVGGLVLRVINGGGSPDSVSVSDGGLTDAGNPGTVTPVSVTNATTKSILITRNNINLATNQVTITHSFTTSVTYELTRI
jgi:hypothetical protein